MTRPQEENVEIVQRGKTVHSATVTMDSVRGFLQLHMSFPTKINFAPEGFHGTYRNVSGTYRNVIERAIWRLGLGMSFLFIGMEEWPYVSVTGL